MEVEENGISIEVAVQPLPASQIRWGPEKPTDAPPAGREGATTEIEFWSGGEEHIQILNSTVVDRVEESKLVVTDLGRQMRHDVILRGRHVDQVSRVRVME